MELTELQFNRQLYKTQPQTTETLEAGDVAVNVTPPPSTTIASGNSVYDVNTNAEQINGDVITPGTIPPSTLNIAVWGWTQTCVFTSVDTDTVSWGSGTFTSANGDSYSISAGTTGNMSARTYIYLDINISTTAYQITTSVTGPVGLGKVLIAVCENETVAATYNLVQASQVVADNILVNSLSAISADLGTITAGSININNKAEIDSSGVSTFSAIRVLNQYTAGENVTAGQLLCFKNTFAAWGDYSGASKNTTALLSKMTYVDGSATSTNFGAANLCFQGQTAGNQQLITYLQLDFTSGTPGIPEWNEVDSVYLRLYVVFSNVVPFTAPSLYLSRVTSSWSENTITFNTRPTDDGIVWASAAVVTESFANENNAINANGTSTGYIDFDITEIYRLWSQGTYTNYGFRLYGENSGNGSIRLGGRTRTGGGDFNQAPFLVSYITKNNPNGTSGIVANDGKVYVASNANYERVKQIAGICGNTVLSGATCNVYSLTNGLCIPTSILSVTNNQDYYLVDANGGIGILTNNILESGKWDFKVGTGSPNGLIVARDTRPLFIRSHSFLTSLPPPNCTTIKMNWHVVDGGASTHNGQIEVSKGFLTSASDGMSGGAADITWNSGTSGLVVAQIDNGGGTGTVTLYFYQ